MNMYTHRKTKVLHATTLVALLVGVCGAQDRLTLEGAGDLLPPVHVAADHPGGGVRRCLIVCGLPGDAPHRKLFADSVELLHSGLVKHQGFAAENIHLLWGDKPTEKDGPAVRATRGEATRESITEAAKMLRAGLQPQDVLWVFVLGHAHYDGKYSWLNVKGDDLHQLDFGRLFEGLGCREQAFFITTAASGFYLKPLAAPGRIVIAATEPDLEVNETLFPHKLAQTIGSPPAESELDIDRDGQRTLLDLYLWTARETAQEYVTGQLLSTEHALIDDTGDGRGSEVQVDYLSEELGGRRRAGRDQPPITKGDGALARRVVVGHLAAPPTAGAKKEVEKPKKDAAKPTTD
jgi:hypothetical protein